MSNWSLGLQWIYAETVETASEEPSAADVGPLVAPPQEILVELLECAQNGYITDIEERLATMKASDPALIPFASRIEHLAATFQFAQIIKLMTSSLMMTSAVKGGEE